jgi:hypothetical protein
MAKSFQVKKQETIFGLEDPLTFGKCKGATLEVVMKEDCRYVRWCLDNIPWFKLDKEAEIMLLALEAPGKTLPWDDSWQSDYRDHWEYMDYF